MGSGAFPFPYPGMLQKQRSSKKRGLPCSTSPESDQTTTDNLKVRKKIRELPSNEKRSNIVQLDKEKSGEPDTKMETFRPIKNLNNFHLERAEEPYGQMAVFGGINGQSLPPPTRMGAAKTLNARAADAEAEAARLAATQARLANFPAAACSSFYNPLQQQKLNNGFNPSGNMHRVTDSKSSTAAFWNQRKDSQFDMQDSERQRTKDKRARPSTVTHVPQFGDDFKLPPIEETSHRGPLRKSESKDKVHRSRGMRPSSGSEVSKIVKIFETGQHRTRDRDQYEGHGKDKRRKQKKEKKESCLAKRFSQATQLDSNIPIILEEDHPARMGKIRRMVKMFDQNAPTYQRSTTIDVMPSASEILRQQQQQHLNSREHPSSNSSSNVFYAQHQQHQQIYSARPEFNPETAHRREIKDAGRRHSKSNLAFHDHDQDEHTQTFIRRTSGESYTNFGHQIPGGSQTQLPAFLKTGKKPAWMMGDRVEVQMEVQEKWDLVNSELRSKMRRGKGKSTNVFRNCRDVHVHTESYYEEMLSEEDQDGSSDGELDF